MAFSEILNENKTYFGLLSNSFALAAMASWDSWSSMTFPNSSIKGSSSTSLSVALEFSPNFWSPLISRTFSWIWSKSAPFCTSLFFLVRFSYFFDQRYPMNKFSILHQLKFFYALHPIKSVGCQLWHQHISFSILQVLSTHPQTFSNVFYEQYPPKYES